MKNTNPKGEGSNEGTASAPSPARTAHRGFSPLTTVIVVVVLLGSLVGVGYMVNPPKPEPPKPEASQQAQEAAATPTPKQAPDAEQMRKMMEHQRQQEELNRRKMEEMTRLNGGKKPKAVNASTTEVTSGYFQDHKMGDEGVKQTEQEIAHQKMLEEAAQKAIGGGKTGPSATPVLSPTGGGMTPPPMGNPH